MTRTAGLVQSEPRLLRCAAFLAVVLLLAGCATLRPQVERVPSEAWPHPEDTTLGRNADAKLAASHGDSGFLLLDSGMDALAARGALAESCRAHTRSAVLHRSRERDHTIVDLPGVARRRARRPRALLVDDLSAAGKELHLGTRRTSQYPGACFQPVLHAGSAEAAADPRVHRKRRAAEPPHAQ